MQTRPHPVRTATYPGIQYSAAPSFDYVPGLDGLRALSVMIVAVSHAGLGRIVPGGFGVTVFFAISGFLITRQLLAEQAAKGQVVLGAFYLRRLLRLYPALLVALALGGGLCWALGAEITGGQVLAGVLYYTNYNALFVPYNDAPAGMYHPFAVLWSLAVEEHYYLVFPGLVFLLGRTRLRFALALCLAIAAVTVWRAHVAAVCSLATPPCIGDGADARILDGTDTRLDSILYGAVLATLLGSEWQPKLLNLLRTRACFAAGVAMLAASLAIRDPMFRDTVRFTLQGVGLFLAVGSVLFSPGCGWARFLLSLRPVLLLGRWSYSLYLGHSFVLMAFAALLPASVWRPAIEDGRLSLLWDGLGLPAVLVVSVGLAALSYTYVEMPMVAVRRRFGSHAVRDGAPARAAAGCAPGPAPSGPAAAKRA